MSLLTYSCLALPLWGALFALYFILRGAKLARESLIAKCAASFLAVGSAGLALCLGGENPLTQPVFWFFLLCTAADALLELQFVLGMLVFGGAHVCLVVWLWGLAPVGPWSLAVWAAAYLGAAWLFRKELPTLGRLTLPFCLYPALLGASLALGVVLPFTVGAEYWPLAVGTACFFVSDMMVAKGELSHLPDFWHKPVMLLYWAALYLIAAPLWS
ncbi:MAG: hypothetical protein HFE94_06710 [Acutalibacter sp.]|nr:hypothetical protein [Acutalibacter sp.]